MGDNEKSTVSVTKVLRFSFLILFTGLFFFSMGVFVGKKWSDRRHTSELKNNRHDKVVKGRIFGKKKTYLRKNKTKVKRNKKEITSSDWIHDGQGDSIQKSERTSYTSIIPSQVSSGDFVEIGIHSNLMVLPKNQFPEDTGEAVPPKSSEVSASEVDKRFFLRSGRKIKNKTRFYTVQVAAYRTEEEAQEHVQSLVDKGFPAFLFKKDLKGERWFRVNIGSFKTKREALKYEKALKKQTWIKKSFIRRISRPVTGESSL